MRITVQVDHFIKMDGETPVFVIGHICLRREKACVPEIIKLCPSDKFALFIRSGFYRTEIYVRFKKIDSREGIILCAAGQCFFVPFNIYEDRSLDFRERK